MSAHKPTRSACFQPDNYSDPELFANRTELLEDLTSTLESFLSPGAPGSGRILVRGHRGVGKSILTRAALDRVVDTLGPLAITVDAARTGHGPDAFLRHLAADLAREALQNTTDPELIKSAELLQRFAQTSKLTVKQVKQWSSSLKIDATAKSGFLDKVQFEFGMTRASGRSRSVEESFERAVDADFLRDLLQGFLRDARNAGQHIVLFLDNLDQVGYGEVEDDIQRVSNLARHLFGLEDVVVLANLRSEFVSSDLRKLYSIEKIVPGLAPAELALIAEKRIAQAGETQRQALAQAGFSAIIGQLSHWTDNAWSLLSWLAFFDYLPIDFAPSDARALRSALLDFAERRYAGLSRHELELLGPVYQNDKHKFVTQFELDTHGVTQELLGRAIRFGALIPDVLLSPDRYMLSPVLHFLTVTGA